MFSIVRLDCSALCSEVDQDEKMLDEDETDSEVDEDITIDSGEQENEGEFGDRGKNRERYSFSSALAILCSPVYHLMDAYPQLRKVYSVAVAISISSCTAERHFPALKRIKTHMMLTGLMLMSVEREILIKLQNDSIIDKFARSAPEQSKRFPHDI